jgi:hypothetical protein
MTPLAVATASLTFCKPLVTHVPLTQYKTSFFKMQELIHRRSDMRMADQLLPTRFSALKYGSAARLRFCR